MQPNKYSKKNFKMELQKKPKTTSEVLEKPAVLSYEELGGLSDPGPQDCVHTKGIYLGYVLVRFLGYYRLGFL
jgi:hypothetical protein